MNRVIVLCATVVFLAGAAGCKTTSSSGEAPAKEPRQQRQRAAKKPPQAIPADSPLAKIAMGMKRAQVYEILGPPTSTRKFPSGKMFNPFYYGPDNIRTGAFYQGLGRIVFSGVDIVVEIEYDPSEDGR